MAETTINRFKPLGVDSGSELRAPSTWPKARPWPLSVEEARAGLGRNPMRSAAAYFAYGAALAHAALTAPKGSVDDLVEAYSVFSAIAKSENAHHFGKYRTIALYNATVCMMRIPSRLAKGIAGDLLLRAAEALGDGAEEMAKVALRGRTESLISRYLPAPLKWGKRLGHLVADSDDAHDRMRVFHRPVEDSWGGVRSSLLHYGLAAPEDCVIKAPVVKARPSGNCTIKVCVA
jgi:hypothetical protein